MGGYIWFIRCSRKYVVTLAFFPLKRISWKLKIYPTCRECRDKYLVKLQQEMPGRGKDYCISHFRALYLKWILICKRNHISFVYEQLKIRGAGEGPNLQPVFIKSFKVEALWVPLARHPNATHKAVRIALFPPAATKFNSPHFAQTAKL